MKIKISKQTYVPLEFLVPQEAVEGLANNILDIAQRELGKSSKEMVVLDIGSGKGEYAIEIAKRVKKVIGIEPYKPFLEIAKKLKKQRKSKALFYEGYIEDYKTDIRFDLALSLTTIEHMPDSKKSFENVFKLLKEGGLIYLTAPNKLWPIEQHYLLPFLSYLPLPLANFYLSILGKGKSYEASSYSKTYFGMKEFLSQFSSAYYFYIPDPKSVFFGESGKIYKFLYKAGIFLISRFSLFWIFSKAFIIIIKKQTK